MLGAKAPMLKGIETSETKQIYFTCVQAIENALDGTRAKLY